MASFIEIDVVESSEVVDRKFRDDKVTDATITQNEYTKLLCVRSNQLKVGAPPTIEWKDRFDPIAIAKEEINQRTIPYVIIRKIPNAKSKTGFIEEIWDIKDLNIRDW